MMWASTRSALFRDKRRGDAQSPVVGSTDLSRGAEARLGQRSERFSTLRGMPLYEGSPMLRRPTMTIDKTRTRLDLTGVRARPWDSVWPAEVPRNLRYPVKPAWWILARKVDRHANRAAIQVVDHTSGESPPNGTGYRWSHCRAMHQTSIRSNTSGATSNRQNLPTCAPTRLPRLPTLPRTVWTALAATLHSAWLSSVTPVYACERQLKPAIPQSSLSLPVVFYSASIFFQGAVRALRQRTLDMMVLVAVAIGTGWLYSVVITLAGGGDVFYEAASVLATFVLLGHWFEMRARGGANDAIRTLLDLAPAKAVVIRNGEQVEVRLPHSWSATCCSSDLAPRFRWMRPSRRARVKLTNRW
jgi:hypothetical protein